MSDFTIKDELAIAFIAGACFLRSNPTAGEHRLNATANEYAQTHLDMAAKRGVRIESHVSMPELDAIFARKP